jgi:hypothetical protein
MRGVSGAGAVWMARHRPAWATTLILANGQSLSVGYQQAPVSTSQPYANVKLHDSSGVYDITAPNAGTLSLVPLVAPQRPVWVDGSILPYPNNLTGPPSAGGESPEISMANEVTRLGNAAGLAMVMAASCTGESGEPMSVIEKGGTGNAYAAGIFEATAMKRLAVGSFGVGCILLTHGEADAFFQIPAETYATHLAQMQADYQADLRLITGQTKLIPMLLSQQNSYPPTGCGPNLTALAMKLAVARSSGAIVMVGPKYQYSYVDGAHLSDYRPYGEKCAQAYMVVDQGSTWRPLEPTSIARSGTTVTIALHVPVPPLVFDGSASPPHQSGALSSWANGKGFEAFDAPQAILGGTGAGVSPIVLQVASTANYTTGQTVRADGMNGNTAANVTTTCTVIDGTHIALDGTTGDGPWSSFQGSANLVNIVGVTAATISGSTVTLTLARAPTAGLTIAYAHTPDITAYQTFTGGFPSGRCGILRDSDPYVGPSGFHNYNWCISFSEVVP